MTVSTKAYYLWPSGAPASAGGYIGSGLGLEPEQAPAILWGQGTPAAIAPFTVVQKGSLYMEVNKTDDQPHIWQKVDEGGDTADWVEMLVDEDEGGSVVFAMTSEVFDTSEADAEQVVYHAVSASTVLEAGILYVEGTETSGAAKGDITIGIASGGGEIVAATAYQVAKASGYYQALSIVDGEVAAGESIFVSHDDSDSVGTVHVQLKIRIDA